MKKKSERRSLQSNADRSRTWRKLHHFMLHMKVVKWANYENILIDNKNLFLMIWKFFPTRFTAIFHRLSRALDSINKQFSYVGNLLLTLVVLLLTITSLLKIFYSARLHRRSSLHIHGREWHKINFPRFLLLEIWETQTQTFNFFHYSSVSSQPTVQFMMTIMWEKYTWEEWNFFPAS